MWVGISIAIIVVLVAVVAIVWRNDTRGTTLK
jgi:hypothetical protein